MNTTFAKTLYVALERKNKPRSFCSILKFHDFGKSLIVQLNRTFSIRSNLFINWKKMETTSNTITSYPPRKKGKFVIDGDPKKRSLTSLPVS